jgi:hypothetical protein
MLRRVWSIVGCLVLAASLVACSGGGGRKSNHSQKGLDAPPSHCPMDPRRFADAEKISDFDKGNGCGVRNAWRVRAINGVKLSQPSIMNCAVANSMSRWIATVMQPAAEDYYGRKVVELSVPSHYACRPRNNQRGAKLSEHGRGNAMDVSGFTLSNGDKVIVEQGWLASRRHKAFIQRTREGACKIFRTVLGPGYNRAHADHLHFDLQQHRSGGTFCR